MSVFMVIPTSTSQIFSLSLCILLPSSSSILNTTATPSNRETQDILFCPLSLTTSGHPFHISAQPPHFFFQLHSLSFIFLIPYQWAQRLFPVLSPVQTMPRWLQGALIVSGILLHMAALSAKMTLLSCGVKGHAHLQLCYKLKVTLHGSRTTQWSGQLNVPWELFNGSVFFQCLY